MKPRLLFVGRNRYRLPLDASLARKFDALGERFEVRVLASAPAGAPTGDAVFTLVPPFPVRPLDGLVFYLALPVRTARELRRFRPDAVVAQSAYEAAATLVARRLARVPARVVLDVHGDWRTSTRLYGARGRKLLAPIGDAVAAAAVRRADAVRTITGYTTELVRSYGVEPQDVFPAFMDLEPFTEPPVASLPTAPRALFIGVLEPYKNIDGLADAWRIAAPKLPGATLHIVGEGTRTDVVEQLLADVPGQTQWTRSLTTPEVAAALDAATCLVLPSRSEGMGRVVVEAFCRGRAVIGAGVGGIRDLVEDGANGLLVDPSSADDVAAALVRVLGDRGLAERLGAGALESSHAWRATPAQYADRLRLLVDASLQPRRERASTRSTARPS